MTKKRIWTTNGEHFYVDIASHGGVDGTKFQERKSIPLYSGVLTYFPEALKEVARVSFVGNEQHNPGEPLHWDRNKSTDQLDAAMRHLTDYANGTLMDTDGVSHLAKVAWRVLAQLELDKENEKNTKKT